MAVQKPPSCPDKRSPYLYEECIAQRNRTHEKLHKEARNSIVVRDSVHGLIELPEKHLQLVDSCKFQRLRRVIQLGSVNLVYPGSHHTRFDHSIGVYYLATKVVKNIDLKGCPPDVEEEINKKRELVPVAALLHDLCHGPFSHVTEDIWSLAAEMEGISNNVTEYGKSVHEKWTSDYIKQKNCISNILRNTFRYDDTQIEQIANMIISRKTLKDQEKKDIPLALHEIINGNLDVDKMDYYVRDATLVGVPYGKIDLDRLLMFFTVRQNDVNGEYDLCVKDKAITSVRNMMMARELYYPAVVYHKVPIIAERMIVRCFRQIYERKLYDTKRYADAYQFAEDFRTWDDFEAWTFLNSVKDEKVKNFVNSIMCRKLLKRLDISKEMVDDDYWIRLNSSNTKIRTELEEEIAKSVKIDPFYIILRPGKPGKILDFKIYYEREDKVRTIKQDVKLLDMSDLDIVTDNSKKSETDERIINTEVVSVYSPASVYKKVSGLIDTKSRRDT